jgi:hypothetical protein
MKSSLHRVISFLPFFSNFRFRRLDSASFGTLLYNHFARTTQKTQPGYWWDGLFTAPLHSSKLLDCCLCIRCRGNVFTQFLSSNKHLFWLRYSGFRPSYHTNQIIFLQHFFINLFHYFVPPLPPFLKTASMTNIKIERTLMSAWATAKTTIITLRKLL